jgi:hypothetical protein
MPVAELDRTDLKPAAVVPPARDRALTPGTLVAERYRIEARVGRGGMGEVYRAEDLKLGQTVALKRLAPRLRSRETVDLLYREIRNGRQLSHPNLCRIYDLVETRTDCFVSMEFVEGEDLASLLRRIGRLPHAKALEIARDLASGLSAIHERGMLHRDLKPANVILDQDGRARITDFGLAVFSGDVVSGDISGTASYMAPELLRGGVASVSSDVYAMGLTLYEAFTGVRPHAGRDLEAILASHEVDVPPPSHFCPNIDPVVERAILCCVERDPELRPRRAHHLLRVLPRVDHGSVAPGEERISAPELITEASAELRQHAGRLTAVMAGAVLALLSVAFLSGRTGMHALVARSPSSPVLAQKARELLAACGLPEPAQTHSFWAGMVTPEGVVPVFAYRESEGPVDVHNEWGRWSSREPSGPGTALVLLDARGRLRTLVLQPQKGIVGKAGAASMLMAAAQVVPGTDGETAPQVLPPVGHEERRAWLARSDEGVVRVETATASGVPVYFDVLPRDARAPTLVRLREDSEPDLGFPPLLYFIITAVGMTVAVVACRHNIVRGRADRRSASHLATYVFVITFLAWTSLANHVLAFTAEWVLLTRGIATALLHAAVVWVVYIAVEPYVRRQWPHMVASWSRLLGGHFRTPALGRDTLIGIAVGVVGRLILMIDETLPASAASVRAAPHAGTLLGLGSPGGIAFVVLYYQFIAIFFSLGLAFLLLLLRRVAWNDRAALVTLWILVSAVGVSGENPAVELTLSLTRNALVIWTLYRFGIHALAMSWLTYYIVLRVPLTLDITAWYGPRSFMTIAAIAALSAYAFHLAVGRRQLMTRFLSAPYVPP